MRGHLPAPIINAFENDRISDFQGLVTLTLVRVILHTIMHHSSTSTVPTYQISLRSEENFFWESQLSLLPSSKSRDTKIRTNQKSGPDKL